MRIHVSAAAQQVSWTPDGFYREKILSDNIEFR